MSALTDFYSGTGKDGGGRTLGQILGWSDDQLEDVHDYIQWLFPLPEASGANPWAPVLDPATIAAFHQNQDMQAWLRGAFHRMLTFYGLVEHGGGDGPAVEAGPEFEERARNWLHPGNHNHLRITRILRSLRVLGLDAEAQRLWRFLEQLYRVEEASGRPGITERTFAFWRRAATGPTGQW